MSPRLYFKTRSIHEGYGVTREGGTTFVNASACDLRDRPVQPPIVVDL